MFKRQIGSLLSAAFLLAFFVGACAPVSHNKSEVPEASSSDSAMARADSVQKTSAVGDVSESSSASSLDAWRKGVAPNEGPLKTIYFDFDRYDLSAAAREVLKANATWLKAHPSAKVEIEGHCDERGTNEYNLGLGAKRSQAARDYLVTLGIAAERIKTISYGEEIPVCRDQTESCWQKNRNARFVVVPSGPVT